MAVMLLVVAAVLVGSCKAFGGSTTDIMSFRTRWHAQSKWTTAQKRQHVEPKVIHHPQIALNLFLSEQQVGWDSTSKRNGRHVASKRLAVALKDNHGKGDAPRLQPPATRNVSSALLKVMGKYNCLDRLITLPVGVHNNQIDKSGEYYCDDTKQVQPYCEYWAEIYRNGVTEVVQIQEIILPNNTAASSSLIAAHDQKHEQRHQEQEEHYSSCHVDILLNLQPKFRVATIPLTSSTTITIDLGQVTSIWKLDCPLSSSSSLSSLLGNLTRASMTPKKAESIPRALLERVFDRVHASTVRKGRKTDNNTFLSKNQINAEAESVASMLCATTEAEAQRFSHEAVKAYVEQVLRKVQKTGSGFVRLLDSHELVEALDHHGVWESLSLEWRKKNDDSDDDETFASSLLYQSLVASFLLTRDAAEGGRFKRWSSVLVGYDPMTGTVSLLNGGWIVQDQSVRASLEAQKMVLGRKGVGSSSNGTDGSNRNNFVIASDKRILRRLECLAMGEQIGMSNGNDDKHNTRRLHLDVKQALAALELPSTPQGAQEALLQLGHWSRDLYNNPSALMIQPWPQDVLKAASKYALVDQARLVQMEQQHDRVDLSKLPCICVDAKGTTFRDDAIGIRPRQGTGRRVLLEASKWEVLIHIADVSDLYAKRNSDKHQIPEEIENNLSLLRAAAESRGNSRYDLPFGPLHLLPPVALDALGLVKKKSSVTTLPRCITLWAYIDERDGKVLDAGIERTIVAEPKIMTYEFASALMEKEAEETHSLGSINTSSRKERLTLLAVERILLKWTSKRQEQSELARKREARLSSKQEAGHQQAGKFMEDEDDIDFFCRTRAHRLVDAALDLYTYCGRRFLNRANAPVPFAHGAGRSEGARLATAPLRRYIDGECQRQLLAVVLGYGTAMSVADCRRAGGIANDSRKLTLAGRAANKRQSSSA